MIASTSAARLFFAFVLGVSSSSAQLPILPIPIVPGDASTCGENLPYPCDASNWVYCINANCDTEPTVDPNLYGGKPFVKCACWQQTIAPPDSCLPLPNVPVNRSILPVGKSGANCVLDNMPGGQDMCDMMKAGALVSTYGPEGYKPNMLESAHCAPRTPWAWCWGAPCVNDPFSEYGITCHCPYMFSDVDVVQPISLAGKAECGNFGPTEPCDALNPLVKIHNSMPAGTSPNSQTPCYVGPGAEECTECCNTPPPTPPGPPKKKGPKKNGPQPPPPGPPSF